MELLIVEIGHAYVGVPTSDVREVVRAARLSPTLGDNANIKGLLNLRGAVVPVVAMRALLGLEEREITSTDHFIVLQNQSATFAIHVDRAVEILTAADPTWDGNDPSFTPSLPREGYGVISIHRGSSLWTLAGLSSPTSERSIA